MNPKIKISQLPAKGSNLAAADLLEVAEFTGTGYISKSITGQEIIDAAVGNVDWGDIGGTLSDQTDLNTALSGKVPTTRTLTINGTTQDLSADRTFTISTGITIGTTAITSGTVGRVLFEGTGNVVQESANLFWDATNNRLGIGTSSPLSPLDVVTSAVTIYPRLRTTSTASNTDVGLRFQDGTTGTANNKGLYVGRASSINYLWTYEAEPLVFGTNNTERVRVFGSTGNVAINTTTDAGFRLDVNGTARVSGNLTVATGFQFLFNNTNVGLYRDANTLRLGGFGGIEFLASAAAISSQTIRMKIFDTGNVLINTTTDAGFKLDVNGTARVQGSLSLTAGNVINIGNVQALAPNTGNDLMVGFNNSLLTFYTGNNPVGRFFSTGNFAIGTTTDVASSKLTIQSTTQGFLPPRMTTTQKNAIATPATGLQVYDTTLNRPCFYDGTTWITL